ncbi:hypothetical protein [Streptomyces lydicus]|uniref:hypothetical protein n=1 Tax=Streptomyces lydicus TaxID=47763 RepID=UPI0013DD87D0|nr:hypothetical protein [Streptomyces lydicus]
MPVAASGHRLVAALDHCLHGRGGSAPSIDTEERPAGAALIRALVRTGAELVVVPRVGLPLEEGVGALLRYVDPHQV